jgi:DNA-3-methyladenine glycosylase II
MKYSTKLKPLSPFNFDLCGHIFSQGHSQIRRYERGEFWQVVRIDDLLVLVTLNSNGTTDKPELSLKIESLKELSKNSLKKIKDSIIHIYNLYLDLNRFYQDIDEDGVIELIINQLIGLKNPITPTIFESLVDSIIEQQISLKVAHTLQDRMIIRFGYYIEINGSEYYSYPTPHKLLT